jgi:hypothetical protein
MKDRYTEIFLKAAEEEYDNDKIENLKKIWWFNLRGKDEGGLRLTEAAINFIEEKSKIKTYKIDLSSDIAITPQVLIWLDHFINSPYYLDKKYIKVLSERAAFELYLFSGDVRKYGLSRSLSKRLNQDQPPSKT